MEVSESLNLGNKLRNPSSVVQVELLPHQVGFITSNKKYEGLIAGLGAGKTDAGTNFVVRMVVEQPVETKGFIGANGIKQLNRAVLGPLFRAFDAYGIHYEYFEQKQLIIANGRTIMVGTTDKDAIEAVLGTEIGWYWLDEAARAPEYAHKLLMGRLRCKFANGLYGRYTSTPYGFNWFYDFFEGPKKTDDNHYYHATSFDNPFLPADYIPNLRKNFTPKEFEQEVLAKFVNMSGSVVYDCFDKRHIVDFDHKRIPGPIYVGMDFNVAQMCIVFVKYYEGRFYLFDELYLTNSNTFEASRKIREKFPNYRNELLLVPDSTFKNRSANSTMTSKEILKLDEFQILNTVNPRIGDRQQTVNAAFYNGGSHENKILVHPRCRNTIKEFFTTSPDQTEGDVSHCAVAFGYVVWKLAPLKRPRPQPRKLHV